jgi:hypothetical protein
MNPRILVAAIALLLAGGVVAIGGHHAKSGPTSLASPTPTIVRPSVNCAQLPKRIATPSWLPADLPLPPGSYAAEIIPPASSQRATFAVKASLSDFVRFILREWKEKRGWALGHGDAEPGEADDSFRAKDNVRVGAFKARSIYCDENWTLVLLVLTKIQR